jgi:hypothetical protein
MRASILALLAAAGAVAVVAIGGRAGATPTAAVGPTYVTDVKPILDARCAGCHMQGGIAPFSLTSYADARKYRGAVAQAVRSRRMPPWHAQRGVRAYLHDPSLTNAQISTIVRWAEQGAPRGSAQRPGRPVAPIGGGLSRVDLQLAMPTAYTPRRASVDDYRCFVLDWSPATPTYVTGTDIAPGTRTQVHHIIVYLAPPAAAATVERWDAADPAPGYRCYGGPSASGAQGSSINFMTGWAPGSGGGDFPAGTGQRIEPGSRLVMQVHYNVQGRQPAPDRSTVRLSLATSVERRAVYVPVVDIGWLISRQTFRIPAGAKRVPHAFSGDFAPFVRFLGGFDPSRGYVVHSAALHMHRLGRTARLDVIRASGARVPLLSIPRWDFNWQRDYRFAQPTVVQPGDRIAIRCTHGNPTRRSVTWGEDTTDEMCIGFVYVSER